MAINFFENYGINRVISLSVAGRGFSYIDKADRYYIAFALNRGDLQREDINVAREYILIIPIYNRLVFTEIILLKDIILEAVRIIH
jgi:hypothetical protein